MHLPLQPEPEEEPAHPREKELFYKTTRLKGTNLFGRESLLLQPKKRIGENVTKVPHHCRMLTDSKAQLLAKFSEKRLDMAEPARKRRGSMDRVQIVEVLDDGADDCKSDVINMDSLEARVDRQIVEAEELVRKVTENGLDAEDCFVPRRDTGMSPERESKESFAEENDDANEEPGEEREMGVTVGEVMKDIAVFVTEDYHLFAWPLDMLPAGVTKGAKLSLLMKRNTNSEFLRKNAIRAKQSEILQSIPNE